MKKIYILMIAATIGLFSESRASIHLIDNDLTNYPNVSSKLYVFGEGYEPLKDYSVSDVKLFELDEELPILNLDCADSEPHDALSVVLTYDLAINNASEETYFYYAQQLGRRLVEYAEFEKLEFALTSYDIMSYLNMDYSYNFDYIQQTINGLIPQKGSLIEEGLLSTPSGAIEVAKLGKFSKSIILITDFQSSFDADKVVEQALDAGVTINCVTLSIPIPDNLKKICEQTGGAYFERAYYKRSPDGLAKMLLASSFGHEPCTINWRGLLTCDTDHLVKVKDVSRLDSSYSDYSVSEDYKPYLEIDEMYIGFRGVPLGEYKEEKVRFTARNKAIKITGFSIVPEYINGVFTIESGDISSPKTLQPGYSHELTIRYTPADSTIVFCKVVAESEDACDGKEVYVTGGYPNKPPNMKTLDILYPTCGDVLVVGDTAHITWEGLLPRDVIQLEYSLDGGEVWDTLAKNVQNLYCDWPVPDILSDSCYIRAYQLWPNNIGKTLDFPHKDAVRSAMFNREGDLLVTASQDTTACVWYANTGEKKYTLRGHTKSVEFANFSPNDKYIATASDDNTAIIWETETGQPLRTLRHGDKVQSANFSPDSRRLITASFDKTAVIWDVETGEKIKTIDCGQGVLWFAVYNPDGAEIATSGYNKELKIWNSEGEYLRSIMSEDIVNHHITYSPDGEKLVSSSILGRARVWNLPGDSLMYSITHPDDSTGDLNIITYCAFDSTGRHIISSGIDKARVWDAEKGVSIGYPLEEHRGSINTAVFNFDGMRILTASGDGTAKVWNLNKKDLQMDTSCVFEISKADARLLAKIDFDKVAVGDVADTVVSGFIVNESNFAYKVKEIKVTGPHKDDFEFIKGDIKPFVIEARESVPLELRFKPTGLGPRTAEIKAVIPGKELKQALIGEGVEMGLQPSARNIEFGRVEIGDFKDTTVTVVVKNKSLSDIFVEQIRNVGPDEERFRIIEGGEPVLIPTLGTHEMTFRYIPESEVRSNAQIQFIYEGKGSPARIILSAEGVKPRVDTATISISSAEGKPDDVVEFAISLGGVSSQGLAESIRGFKTNLSFDRTLLEPLENQYPTTIEGDVKTMEIELPTAVVGDSILAKLHFRVALGADTTTALSLSNSAVVGEGKVKLYESSGEFRLTDYCEEGGVRLFEDVGKIFMSQNVPNPFSVATKIEFEVIESGYHEIVVSDMTGRTVAKPFAGYLTAGKNETLFDAGNLPSGVYYYTLYTPTKIITKRMEIKK